MQRTDHHTTMPYLISTSAKYNFSIALIVRYFFNIRNSKIIDGSFLMTYFSWQSHLKCRSIYNLIYLISLTITFPAVSTRPMLLYGQMRDILQLKGTNFVYSRLTIASLLSNQHLSIPKSLRILSSSEHHIFASWNIAVSSAYPVISPFATQPEQINNVQAEW